VPATELRAALFDAAGTLFELVEPVGETYARFARAHDVEVRPDRIEAAWHAARARCGPPFLAGARGAKAAAHERQWWREVVSGTFREAAPSARFQDFEAFFAELFEHYAGPEAWRLRDGARAGLRALRRSGLRLGIVSNFDHRLPKLLQSLGIAMLFDTIAIPAQSGLAKPDPALFRVALDALGAAPSQSVHVGDHPHLDLAAARALGMRALDPAELVSLAELPARLATLCARHRAER
jgi:putative hydrolase of the HAD superfamily